MNRARALTHFAFAAVAGTMAAALLGWLVRVFAWAAGV